MVWKIEFMDPFKTQLNLIQTLNSKNDFLGGLQFRLQLAKRWASAESSYLLNIRNSTVGVTVPVEESMSWFRESSTGNSVFIR